MSTCKCTATLASFVPGIVSCLCRSDSFIHTYRCATYFVFFRTEDWTSPLSAFQAETADSAVNPLALQLKVLCRWGAFLVVVSQGENKIEGDILSFVIFFLSRGALSPSLRLATDFYRALDKRRWWVHHDKGEALNLSAQPIQNELSALCRAQCFCCWP